MNRLCSIAKGVWQFCSFLFWPRWGNEEELRYEAAESK